MKKLMIIAAMLLCGCYAPKQIAETQATDFVSYGLFSTTLDDHKFVIARVTSGVSIIHHPGCKCLSVESK